MGVAEKPLPLQSTKVCQDGEQCSLTGSCVRPIPIGKGGSEPG